MHGFPGFCIELTGGNITPVLRRNLLAGKVTALLLEANGPSVLRERSYVQTVFPA